jgi:hypothetical protein
VPPECIEDVGDARRHHLRGARPEVDRRQGAVERSRSMGIQRPAFRPFETAYCFQSHRSPCRFLERADNPRTVHAVHDT